MDCESANNSNIYVRFCDIFSVRCIANIAVLLDSIYSDDSLIGHLDLGQGNQMPYSEKGEIGKPWKYP